MRLRIEGGTARLDEPSLCVSCRHALIARGRSLRDEIVECGRLSEPHNRIRFDVTSCSGYVNRCHDTLSGMESVAWILRSDPKRNAVGFVRAAQLKPHERYVLPDDLY